MEHEILELERDLIRQAVIEDRGSGDLTSIATISPDARGMGRIRAKEELILAGLPYARCVYEEIDPSVDFQSNRAEGSRLQAGEIAATLKGPLRSLLAGERLALNLLQRLSGIATMTSRFVEAAAGTAARISDTRKTTPLWRISEKYAVRVGGGVNHRMGLYDRILIKDNHIDAVGSVEAAVRKARALVGEGVPIIVEIRRVQEIDEAIDAGADRLLLDNMDVEELALCVRKVNHRALTEASGNVTLKSVREIAGTGVDFISVGLLTHSIIAADLNLKIVATEEDRP